MTFLWNSAVRLHGTLRKTAPVPRPGRRGRRTPSFRTWLLLALIGCRGLCSAGDFVQCCATDDAEEVRRLIELGADVNMIRPEESGQSVWLDDRGKHIFATTLRRFNEETNLADLEPGADGGGGPRADALRRGMGRYVAFFGSEDGEGERLLAEISLAGLLPAVHDGDGPLPAGSGGGKLTPDEAAAASGSGGMRPLMAAALFNRDPAVVTVLAEAGAAVNVCSGDGTTPLMLSVFGNAPEVVAALLDAGADITATTGGEGLTALALAASCNPDPRMTELLLARGALSGDGAAPVLARAAARNPNPEICRLLLDAGQDLLARAPGSGNALEQAARHNPNPEVLRLLLEKAGNNASGLIRGLLGEALAHNPNPKVCLLLMGLPENARTRDSRLFFDAMRYPTPERVALLLDAGYKTEKSLLGALHRQEHIASPASLDLLLGAMDKVSAREFEEELPRFVEHRSPELALIMLKHRRVSHSDPDARDILRQVLFTNPRPDVALALLDAGVPLLQPLPGYPDGFDPRRKILICALRQGREELAAGLLARGVNPNPVMARPNPYDNDADESPLAVAAVHAPALVPLLLEKGADPRLGKNAAALLETVSGHCPQYRETLVRSGAAEAEGDGHE